MNVVGLQWEHSLEPFFQFLIKVSQWNFEKEKLLINSLSVWQLIFEAGKNIL